MKQLQCFRCPKSFPTGDREMVVHLVEHGLTIPMAHYYFNELMKNAIEKAERNDMIPLKDISNTGSTINLSDLKQITLKGNLVLSPEKTHAATGKDDKRRNGKAKGNAIQQKENTTQGQKDDGCSNCRRDSTKCKKTHQFKCKEEGCNYVSNTKGHFKEHKKAVHEKIKDMECPKHENNGKKCQYICSDKSNLKRHIKLKHGDANKFEYQCDVCPGGYYTFMKGDWKRHERTKKHKENMEMTKMLTEKTIQIPPGYKIVQVMGYDGNVHNLMVPQDTEVQVEDTAEFVTSQEAIDNHNAAYQYVALQNGALQNVQQNSDMIPQAPLPILDITDADFLPDTGSPVLL